MVLCVGLERGGGGRGGGGGGGGGGWVGVGGVGGVNDFIYVGSYVWTSLFCRVSIYQFHSIEKEAFLLSLSTASHSRPSKETGRALSLIGGCPLRCKTGSSRALCPQDLFC